MHFHPRGQQGNTYFRESHYAESAMLIQRELILMTNITKELSILNNYKGRKVLITGHTGFKGSWMCCVLSKLGAEVAGYSIDVPTKPSLYELSGIGSEVETILGDVRDLNALSKVFDEFKPEIVIHMIMILKT